LTSNGAVARYNISQNDVNTSTAALPIATHTEQLNVEF
jgi:hypothetical protein